MPKFLALMFTQGGVHVSSRGRLYSEDAVPARLFEFVDITGEGAAGGRSRGGWFIALNPKRASWGTGPLTVDALRERFIFVAWWVPPEYYAAFKTWIEQTGHINEDQVPLASAPTLKKSEGYFCTWRDVPEIDRVDVFSCLLRGTEFFLTRLFGAAALTASVLDFHYPSQLIYSSLHCQIRHRNSVSFPIEQRGTRYSLQLLSAPKPPNPAFFEYLVCTNSFHSLWILLVQQQVPYTCKRLCGAFGGILVTVGLYPVNRLPFAASLRALGMPVNDGPLAALLQRQQVRLGIIMEPQKFEWHTNLWKTLERLGYCVIYLGDETHFTGASDVDHILYTLRTGKGERIQELCRPEQLLEPLESVRMSCSRQQVAQLFQRLGIRTPWNSSHGVWQKHDDSSRHATRALHPDTDHFFQAHIPSDQGEVLKVSVAGSHLLIASSLMRPGAITNLNRTLSEQDLKTIAQAAAKIQEDRHLFLFGLGACNGGVSSFLQDWVDHVLSLACVHTYVHLGLSSSFSSPACRSRSERQRVLLFSVCLIFVLFFLSFFVVLLFRRLCARGVVRIVVRH